MSLKYLVTGATGGLGSHVLTYLASLVPHCEFAAASRKPENREIFENCGMNFRHVDYEDTDSLDTAFTDLENLLFVSTNAFDPNVAQRQHKNVIDAAKRRNVKHVWYTSLAFGGLTKGSKVSLQQIHYATERLLMDSGVTYTSIRQGIYAETFPLFLNWFPETVTITLPQDGNIAFTSRKELAEADARLMINGGFDNEIVLLTAQETITGKELVDIINATASNKRLSIQFLPVEDYIRTNALNDVGGKPEWFFGIVASWWQAAADGELQTTDRLMQDVLGRRPMSPHEAVKQLLHPDGHYTWHQNYFHQSQQN